MAAFTLKRKEMIKSKKTIDYLFCGGAKSFCVYPIRVVYKEQINPNIKGHTILVSVSKRKFKRAVDRNRVKRLLRESYRLNKSILSKIDAEQNKPLALAFIYLSDELPSQSQINEAIQKLFTLIVEDSTTENA